MTGVSGEGLTEGAGDFPHLYSPLELRGKVLRNRIVSTPHATGWGRDGLIDRSEVDYHVRKAAGGCALVMTFGSASVDPTTEASYGSIALWDERNEPALRALADGVHGHGGLCMSQMTHMGRRGTSTHLGHPAARALRPARGRPPRGAGAAGRDGDPSDRAALRRGGARAWSAAGSTAARSRRSAGT